MTSYSYVAIDKIDNICFSR